MTDDSTSSAEKAHVWRAVGPNAGELWNQCLKCRADEGTVAGRLPCKKSSVDHLSTPPAVRCDMCGDTGQALWAVEADPNLYQEVDDDGMVPCIDCALPPGSLDGGESA